MLVRRGVSGAAGGASRGGEGVMTCSLAGRPQKTSDRFVAFRVPQPRARVVSWFSPACVAVPPPRFATNSLCFAEFEVGKRPKSGIKLCKTLGRGAESAEFEGFFGKPGTFWAR